MQQHNAPLVFISYAKDDIESISKICSDLDKFGVSYWVDYKSILPGQDWQYEIDEALSKCRYFLAILSSNSVNKVGYVQKELKLALNKLSLYPKDKIYLLPARIENCTPIEKEIKDLQWVDLFPSENYENGLKKIINSVRKGEMNYLRSVSRVLTFDDIKMMVKTLDYYLTDLNDTGKGAEHEYHYLNRPHGKVVVDRKTGLMWSCKLSEVNIGFMRINGIKDALIAEYKDMIVKVKDNDWALEGWTYWGIEIERACNLPKVEDWFANYHQERYADYTDWRLPTLDELMNLIEYDNKRDRAESIVTDPYFERVSRGILPIRDTEIHSASLIWSSDIDKKGSHWGVDFLYKSIIHENTSLRARILPVRTMSDQELKELED